MRRIVVVGGSLAGHRAARTLRNLGYDASLTVVGAEPHPPYDRFPLSKGYLTGHTDRRALDLAEGPDDVEWLVGKRAARLDLAGRTVVLRSGSALPFDGLVVASGAEARDAAQVRGLRGALALRTVEDAEALRAELSGRPVRVVVVGGGLIGAEVAATAVRFGHPTTLVDPAEVPTERSVGRVVAQHLLQLHQAAGIRVLRGRTRGLDERQGRVTGVVLEDGSHLPAEIVVMATGTTPNVDWLQGNGLRLEGGLHCRATLHAVGSDIVVGAGDVVRTSHPLLPEPVRLEHWASTLDQADLAARNLLGGPHQAPALEALPTFGTTIHRARIRVVGFAQGTTETRVLWGSVESGKALLALGRAGDLVGVVSLNAHKRLPRITHLLRPGTRLDEAARAAQAALLGPQSPASSRDLSAGPRTGGAPVLSGQVSGQPGMS